MAERRAQTTDGEDQGRGREEQEQADTTPLNRIRYSMIFSIENEIIVKEGEEPLAVLAEDKVHNFVYDRVVMSFDILRNEYPDRDLRLSIRQMVVSTDEESY